MSSANERSQPPRGDQFDGSPDDGADPVDEVLLFELQGPRPGIISDLTLVVAFDEEYVEKLRQSWPTWMRFRPWLREVPAVLIHDAALDLASIELNFLGDHRDIRFVPWSMPDAKTQRERMLTSLVHVPAREVQTDWYLKLDADSYATKVTKWVYDKWFSPTDDGIAPVYVSSPWGYTKPPNAIAKLDDWGDGVDELRDLPRLNLSVQKGSSIVRHSRMISQVFFGNTAWTRHVAGFAPDRLPCASQDTYLSYCATRLRCPVRHVRMSEYGWAHSSRLQRLTAACTAVLSNGGHSASA